MNKITWISPYFDLVLDKIPIESKNILEVGCGSGIFGFILKKTRPNAKVVGIEPFEYDLKHYDYVWRCVWNNFHSTTKSAEWRKLKFDVVVCNETIEHMDKNDAISFLNEVKQYSDLVIIVTPYKFDEQLPYDDNEFQKHRCVLSENEFRSNGYKTKLIGFSNRKGYNSRIIYDKPNKLYTKLIGITPTNIMAIWQKPLTSDKNSKSGGDV